MTMNPDYQARLGDRLRSIRNQQGLTLQEVEQRSDGEWKAVVIGSYERGDRAISIPKLARLADFYGVPVADLLPRTARTTPASPAPQGSGIRVDLTQLPVEDDDAEGPIGALARYARRIQLQRGDYNGRVLTLRREDLSAIAAVTGTDPHALTQELRSRRLVA